MRVFANTDIGRCRSSNQDCYYYSVEPVGNLPNLFLVADGMGGHNAGDYASRCTITHMVDYIAGDPVKSPVQIIYNAIRKARNLMTEESRKDDSLKGMGTTLVAAALSEDELLVANIGDSRLYIVQNGLQQITEDHSYVEEMVRKGRMERNSEEYIKKKNIITRAISADAYAQPDFFHVPLESVEQILICTDGLTNMVSDADIQRVLQTAWSVEEKGTRLMEMANENGGKDNITVLLIDRGERN